MLQVKKCGLISSQYRQVVTLCRFAHLYFKMLQITSKHFQKSLKIQQNCKESLLWRHTVLSCCVGANWLVFKTLQSSTMQETARFNWSRRKSELSLICGQDRSLCMTLTKCFELPSLQSHFSFQEGKTCSHVVLMKTSKQH